MYFCLAFSPFFALLKLSVLHLSSLNTLQRRLSLSHNPGVLSTFRWTSHTWTHNFLLLVWCVLSPVSFGDPLSLSPSLFHFASSLLWTWVIKNVNRAFRLRSFLAHLVLVPLLNIFVKGGHWSPGRWVRSAAHVFSDSNCSSYLCGKRSKPVKGRRKRLESLRATESEKLKLKPGKRSLSEYKVCWVANLERGRERVFSCEFSLGSLPSVLTISLAHDPRKLVCFVSESAVCCLVVLLFTS